MGANLTHLFLCIPFTSLFLSASSLRQELMLWSTRRPLPFSSQLIHDSSSFQLPFNSHLHSVGTALAKLPVSNPLTTFLSLDFYKKTPSFPSWLLPPSESKPLFLLVFLRAYESILLSPCWSSLRVCLMPSAFLGYLLLLSKAITPRGSALTCVLIVSTAIASAQICPSWALNIHFRKSPFNSDLKLK